MCAVGHVCGPGVYPRAVKSLCVVGVTAVLVLFGQGTLEGEFVHCSTSPFQGRSPLISTKNNSQHLYTDYHYRTLF